MASFFRYPGGKSKLRAQIVDCLSTQAYESGLEYREPFFGGGSIGLKLLADHSCFPWVWVNDKDVGIACLWTAVMRYPDVFKKHVTEFVPSVEAFYALKQELSLLKAMPTASADIALVGFKKLALHQISYSGLGAMSGGPLGGKDQKSSYKVDCRWSPQYICKKVDAIHRLFAGLQVRQQWCTNLDFADVITNDSCKALIYLDPPYYDKGNELYQHGFSVEDHRRLAILLRNTDHAWVLSYDDCPEIRELYEWASFHTVNVKYSITGLKDEEGSRKSTMKPELLIYPQAEEVVYGIEDKHLTFSHVPV